MILNHQSIQDRQYCLMVALIVDPNGRSQILAAFISVTAEKPPISYIHALINRYMIEELK